MASALMILFLGCWLAGQSGVSGGGTGLTHSGTTPTSHFPSEMGSGNESGDSESPSTPTKTGGSESSPGSEPAIIAGVSAAAAGLLLLLLAFLCYRRKGPAPRQSSTSPLAVLKTPAQEAPVYSNIDNGKEMQTLPKEPDSGTYAELDRQTLQPRVYDVINMSQGVPQ